MLRATARLQLHRGFTFEDAVAQVDHFARLGISHFYVSPILTARAGSMHGYDVIDPTRVNAELGGEDGLRRLVRKLRAREMGLVVDIVPNHMAVGGADNPWWLDVLERGRDSLYAQFFDIDWESPDRALKGRILAPFLGKPYGEALAAGEIALQFDAEHGQFFAQYFEHKFPLSTQSNPKLLQEFGDGARVLAAHDARDPAGRLRLHKLLERQNWRLAWWRTAADEINWRRFFDIISLAALRVEDAAVFDAVHATTLRLYAEGLVDGLRIDHVDGLADPRAYCRKLRARLRQLEGQRPRESLSPAYLIVEKILAPEERLPRDWQVDGTSGYSFMNHVNALLHDPAGEGTLTSLWTEVSGRAADFQTEERTARRRIASELLVSDFNATALALHRVARSNVATRDLTLSAIRRVLMEILVQMPVYRVYADRRGRAEADARLMKQVCEAARANCRPAERAFVEIIDRWLGGEPPAACGSRSGERLRLRAIARFQQLTAPLAAKAVEDTAFYRHGRLLSRNEVGADPAQFAMSVADFHGESQRRRKFFPDTLLATATHDHKRGEDLRARLAVLSERPGEWASEVRAWTRLNGPLHTADAPAPADETMLYQMLVGAWPLELDPQDAPGLHALGERLATWQEKALREAKLRTNWVEPDLRYEAACRGFLDALLDPSRSAHFLRALHAFVLRIAPAGALNGLAQVLLRVTSPGVPDLYQGTDFWDFSLVDPDNRRPVDYAVRRAALDATDDDAHCLAAWRDGRIKQRLIARALAVRRAFPQLFARGAYEPLEIEGAHADRAIAFVRSDKERAAIVIVPRCCAALVDGNLPRIDPQRWVDTRVVLSPAQRKRPWFAALSSGSARAKDFALASLLDPWPVALLTTEVLPVPALRPTRQDPAPADA